jgi:NADPH2:quinone reductase
VRAAVCRSYGSPDVVTVDDDFPAPVLAPGHALVRVEAAAVNFPDVLIIANEYQMSATPPFVPGSEFAGVVTEVAADVNTVAVGDRVSGACFVGAFAEEVVAAPSALTPIPDNIDARTAAAFGVAFRTAYHVLRSVACIEPGEHLIVLGAGGGVGHAAVQIGVALGATVTAVASSDEKLAVAAQLGAANLVNHRSGGLRGLLREVLPDGADVVVDPVGGDLAEPALRALRWGGRFVTVGYASGVIARIPLNLVLLKGVHIVGFQFIDFATHAADELARNEREVLDLLAAGQLRPYVGATFPLDDVVSALQCVGAGTALGKVVLAIGEEAGCESA